MILREALRSTTQTLLRASIDDASMEAELLLGHVLGMSKTQLCTEPERDLTAAETEHLRNLVRRRLDREPAAYILGHSEFYGIDLYVERDTFIPRPETEVLVEKAVELAGRISGGEREITVADIGTGCGAIAISLALALPRARMYATDISASALRVAEKNCQRHAVCGRVELLLGDLLEPLPGPVDMIVANLPYIKDREFEDLSPEVVGFEPPIALTGGKNGLDRIHRMLEQMPGKLNRGGFFLLEIGQGQGAAATSLVHSHFLQASVELIPDLGGVDRVMKVALTGSEPR
jgi:release factor glutamine methyltransferase